MNKIEMHEMSKEFFPCWQAAGIHLSKQVDGGIQSWLRAHPYPHCMTHIFSRRAAVKFLF
jgi:hypothetical protein